MLAVLNHSSSVSNISLMNDSLCHKHLHLSPTRINSVFSKSEGKCSSVLQHGTSIIFYFWRRRTQESWNYHTFMIWILRGYRLVHFTVSSTVRLHSCHLSQKSLVSGESQVVLMVSCICFFPSHRFWYQYIEYIRRRGHDRKPKVSTAGTFLSNRYSVSV